MGKQEKELKLIQQNSAIMRSFPSYSQGRNVVHTALRSCKEGNFFIQEFRNGTDLKFKGYNIFVPDEVSSKIYVIKAALGLFPCLDEG